MNRYTEILKEELIPAFGCTEPIALAYAAAKATQVLGHIPERIICSCSGNIVKNAKSVVVPGTDGLKGIEISVVLGAIAGDPDKELEVLNGIEKNKVAEAKKLAEEGMCQIKLVPNVANLYIKIQSFYEDECPPLVGDISYGMGRSFVRDNIIIEIYGEGNYRGQWQHIAKQIDSYLLRSQTYDSANEAKPVINQFEIAQNPVAYGTITKLILDVIDPSGGELYYDWMFTPGSLDWGGIETDELGNYYYYAETNESVEELTLLAMNYSGFCATAVLYINVTQNK